MAQQFVSYRLYYYSAPQYSWDVLVDLYNEGTWVGRIKFMKEGQAIPANRMRGSATVLYYPISHFDNIMTMLRYEKPLYVNLNVANGIGTILTSSEPVGEEEDG